MKYLKLLLIAIILIGGVSGLVYLNSEPDSIEIPEFSSARANEWKQKIIDLCKEGVWSVTGYNDIEQGIHTDRIASQGKLITMDEEISLVKFLFASSCAYLKNGTDNHFQQTSYSDTKIAQYEKALDHLRAQQSKFEANSNLPAASNLLTAYRQLMKMLSFGATATYSRPLKPYSGGSADGRRSKIQNMPYYKSHFSKNADIRSKVETLDQRMRGAEQEYYANLEKLVENHYKNSGRIEELLEDQMRFEEISTNPSAKKKLNSFVNNPYN